MTEQRQPIASEASPEQPEHARTRRHAGLVQGTTQFGVLRVDQRPGLSGSRRLGVVEVGEVVPAPAHAGLQIGAEARQISAAVALGGALDDPTARAGAIFQAAISSGKLNGMIWPTTPSGSWKW